ncbi:N-acetyl-D-Glu racemase DgcA [Pontivivens insulae]|uniref:Dipeptide epimerase n=1 Tax=Pontivivens insulae TaxID=1639689 RepID=A0A2R8AFL5_9RHOB|nr:N-acetyl-D-Glu racemase DgcA [Pontivivens insulae]RED12114.1 L-alanine-DL-glutamate epimerase-like enolase superfamily enzyme [Pontivivens insulae]SPF30870.1 L-Ala-D/L-Glu epimerase [Pontivivens insulae]
MIQVTQDRFPLAEVFTIARGSRTEARVTTVTITRNGVTGRGECVPYPRYGETPESVADLIEALPADITREQLQVALPGGAARNAVDCALWDLEAKAAGQPAWQLAGLAEPGTCVTAYTLSLGTPEAMEASAAKHAHRPLLKTKLGGGDEDVARIRAVRTGAPQARIIVDANEGWTADQYRTLAPVFVELGVEMVEQPFPAGQDDALCDLDRVLPVCADESCHDRASLPDLVGKYDMINIKLDKTGGLTEALALNIAAREAGFKVMVGCMVGSSLAMAPAMLVAQGAEIVDLDGPLLLAEDRDPPLDFNGAVVSPPRPALWG